MESNQSDISLIDVKKFIDKNFEKNVSSTYRSSINGFSKIGVDFSQILREPVNVAQNLKETGFERQRVSVLFKNLKTILHKMLSDPIMKDIIGNVDTTLLDSFNNSIIKPVFGEIKKIKHKTIVQDTFSGTDEEFVDPGNVEEVGVKIVQEDVEEVGEDVGEEVGEDVGEENIEDKEEVEKENVEVNEVLLKLCKIENLIYKKDLDKNIAFDEKRMADLREKNRLLEENIARLEEKNIAFDEKRMADLREKNRLLEENIARLEEKNKRLEDQVDTLFQLLKK
jgi:hypothetical protein